MPDMKEKIHYDKAAIESAYSKVAWIYDIWSRLTETKALGRALEFASIQNGESVLEVAVGTGRQFERIVNLNPDGRNEGLDISESMLAKARRRLRKHENLHLAHGDASKLPYEDSAFDVLMNNYMLDLLPQEDYPIILREFQRVLKPDGRLVITAMTYGKAWYSRVWDAIARNAPSLLTGCRPIDLEAIIKGAGFRIDQREYITQNTFPSLVLSARA